MMKITRYRLFQERHQAPAEWLDAWQYYHKRSLASDLLDEGLTPGEISIAVKKAIEVCCTMEIPVEQHFVPVYTTFNGDLFKDFRLSEFGFALTLLNAPVRNSDVAAFQFKLVQYFLEKSR